MHGTQRFFLFSYESVAEYFVNRANRNLAIDPRYQTRIKNNIGLRLYIHNIIVECLVFGNQGEVVDECPHSSELSSKNLTIT